MTSQMSVKPVSGGQPVPVTVPKQKPQITEVRKVLTEKVKPSRPSAVGKGRFIDIMV